jgi:hypothetical protein
MFEANVATSLARSGIVASLTTAFARLAFAMSVVASVPCCLRLEATAEIGIRMAPGRSRWCG